MKYSGHRKILCELSKLSKFNALTSSDTKRTMMHLLLFTNSAQKDLVSICTQSVRNCNWLSLHYTLGLNYLFLQVPPLGIDKFRNYQGTKPPLVGSKLLKVPPSIGRVSELIKYLHTVPPLVGLELYISEGTFLHW